jgi:3-isopropylmalate/(R)-2-methylmalate dehydratase small subunit
MEPRFPFTSRLAVLAADHVDTDQIIPARFLTAVSRTGFGAHLFHDWRFAPNGAPRPEFVLNRPEAMEARILLAGANFGCGSSREHAVWALVQFGFRAVVGLSFADIFRQNALKNGLLPVSVTPEDHRRLLELARHDPAIELTIDLAAQTVSGPGIPPASFPVDAFAKIRLLEGIDEIEFVLRHEAAITAYEARQHSPQRHEGHKGHKGHQDNPNPVD